MCPESRDLKPLIPGPSIGVVCSSAHCALALGALWRAAGCGVAGDAADRASDNELMMAGSVVTIPPVLAVFLALQRYYITGLLSGSVKG